MARILMLREQSKPWTPRTGGILSNVAKRQQSSMFKVFGFADISQCLMSSGAILSVAFAEVRCPLRFKALAGRRAANLALQNI
jgi:hypothetical protein